MAQGAEGPAVMFEYEACTMRDSCRIVNNDMDESRHVVLCNEGLLQSYTRRVRDLKEHDIVIRWGGQLSARSYRIGPDLENKRNIDPMYLKCQ